MLQRCKPRSWLMGSHKVIGILSLMIFISIPIELLVSTEHELTFSQTLFVENGQQTGHRPRQCSKEELLRIQNQLEPTSCIASRKRPYQQSCSITRATKCIDAIWLDDYYTEVFHGSQNPSQPFLGISVGCNKGFDAINTLRMGTFDNSFDKNDWQKAMESDGKQLYHSVCGQNAAPQFPIPPGDTGVRRYKNNQRPGEMHCFEPMPQTVKKLKRSAEKLGYDKKGFFVVHGAVSNKPGVVPFPSSGAAGIENNGIENCKRFSDAERSEKCENVDVFTLKDYVTKNIDERNNESGGKASPWIIHILSIDIEGFDVDAILGMGEGVLERVEYLEFEYNWMGSWAKQHLFDVVAMLDGKEHRPIYQSESLESENNDDRELPFTCYWSGEQRLWRITDCWMSYYDIHHWGNVACVNRKLAPRLLHKMEEVFAKTLAEVGIQFH